MKEKSRRLATLPSFSFLFLLWFLFSSFFENEMKTFLIREIIRFCQTKEIC